MVIDPVYVRVEHGRSGLRISATSRAERPQLVRVWGADTHGKASKIPEFPQIELRPTRGRTEMATAAPQQRPAYWLAILVYHQTAAGWERSAPQETGPFVVPQRRLAFDGREALRRAETRDEDPDTILSIDYMPG